MSSSGTSRAGTSSTRATGRAGTTSTRATATGTGGSGTGTGGTRGTGGTVTGRAGAVRPAGPIQIRPLTAMRLEDLAVLFGTNRTTSGCWCMWFRATSREVHAGWGEPNRNAFEALAAAEDPPLGVLAYRDREPVGWCAVAPRERYPAAIGPRARILRDRDPAEDPDVWLVTCFFVQVGHRREGVSEALLRGAVDLAAGHGATAVEGFPLAGPGPHHGDRFVGTEPLFAACGFTPVARPTPSRVVMRRQLARPPAPARSKP